jgi:integrase
VRLVAIPRSLSSATNSPTSKAAAPEPDGFVFIGPKGARLRRQNFLKFWDRARSAVGLPQLHFHDLRYTGNTMAAAQGASLRELMDQQIAAGMGRLYADARRATVPVNGHEPERTGTQRVRALMSPKAKSGRR